MLMFWGAGNCRIASIILLVGFYPTPHYTEPAEIHLFFCKVKFLWVEDNTVVATVYKNDASM